MSAVYAGEDSTELPSEEVIAGIINEDAETTAPVTKVCIYFSKFFLFMFLKRFLNLSSPPLLLTLLLPPEDVQVVLVLRFSFRCHQWGLSNVVVQCRG